MSSLAGLLVVALLIASVYAWYRCHRQLRAKGYGIGLITTLFVVLLVVCLGIGGSIPNEQLTASVPFALWITVAVLLAWGLPYRTGAIKEGRVVQAGTRTSRKRRAVQASRWG